jgi:6-bladed beta-propeller protein
MLPRFLIQTFTLFAFAAAAAAQDVAVVQSKGPGAWGNNLRLVQELRIGELEGAEEYTFGIIMDALAGKDGSIFVAEFRPASIRVYDANGKFLRKAGREGSGPGEYQQIGGLAVLNDGKIAVYDPALGRVSILDAQGNFMRSFQLQTGFFTNDAFHVDDAGHFYVKASAQLPNPGELGLDRPVNWIKASSTGQVLDTFPQPVGRTPPVQLYGGPHDSRVDPLVSTLSRLGGVVSGSPLTYSIDVQRPGQTRLVIQREYKPIALAGAEKSEWEAMAAWLSKQPTSRSFRDGKPIDGPTAKYNAPTVKPAFRSLRVDEENRIWVERYVSASKFPPPAPPKLPPGAVLSTAFKDRPVSVWREPTTYDVFDPNGRFLGAVVAPPKTQFLAMRDKTIWATTRGELDEAYIVRYRIESAK